MELRLPGRPEAVRVARDALEALRGQVEDSVLETIRLLTSEVVTNGIHHGRSSRPADDALEVRVWASDHRIRVEVTDPGRGFTPVIRAPAADQASGWGLFIVDRLSTNWGVAGDGCTKVWFELRSNRRSRGDVRAS